MYISGTITLLPKIVALGTITIHCRFKYICSYMYPLFDPICIFARFMPEKAALLADRVLTELVKVCASHGTIISTWLGPLLVWNVNWVVTDLIFEIPGTQG